MPGKRRYRRIIKRLNAEFFSAGKLIHGTSSNLSEGGLFLRTQKPMPAESRVDVSIQLPDDTVSRIKGTVRWSLKSSVKSGRSGMGIEISEYDRPYVTFLNTLLSPQEQIIYKERKNAMPLSPAEKIEPAATKEIRPVTPRKSEPAPFPKSPPTGGRKTDRDTEDNEIDSLISSLFSKREEKLDEE